MKNYINKDTVTTISTVTEETEFWTKPSEDGIYFINNKQLSEEELTTKFFIVRKEEKFFYKQPIVFANNFTKFFETEIEMNSWLENNFSNFILISDTKNVDVARKY